MLPRPNVDVDAHGYPKAPIDDDCPLSEDQLVIHEQKRQEVLARQPEQRSVPPAGGKLTDVVSGHMTSADYDELGYPKLPPEWNEEYFADLMEKEKTDPNVNPNLLINASEAEFWYNAARKPYAKAIQRSEKHWTNRRNVWLRQYETVEMLNETREELTEQLEDCSMEVKRLVTPILQYKITEATMWNFLREARQLNTTLSQLLQSEERVSMLRGLRRRIDIGGPKDAELMMEEYDMRSRRLMFDKTRAKEMEKKDRVLSDCDTLVKCLNWGQKCKKDGMIEWEKGNHEEALASWRQAEEALKKYKAPESDKNGNQIIAELHIAVLKNVAQAAIKCEYYTEALDASDDAIKIDSEDHKAWFRRACALEGLGQFMAAEEALDRIDTISIGRSDQHRIQKDTQAKRDKLQAIADRNDATQRRGLERALARGIFGDDRETRPVTDELQKDPEAILEAEEEKLADEVTLVGPRKRLTKDGADDLLEELQRAYGETLFQKQVRKLAVDVRRDRVQFITHMRKVCLAVQKPILLKWGFEPSAKGVKEMQSAIQDHTIGQEADDALREKADAVTQILYGDMYSVVYLGLQGNLPIRRVNPEELELLE